MEIHERNTADWETGPGRRPCLLPQAESDIRFELRFERLKKNAAFRYLASIEEINMDPSRGIDKIQLMDLATLQYIERAEPIIIVGATGCGNVN